jgi:hypothetical protein
MRVRTVFLALTLALAVAVAPPLVAVAKTPSVKAPRDGQWTGKRNLLLIVSGDSIEVAAFDFPCGEAKGRTTLNDIPLKKTKRGYKFSTQAHGNVTYSDDHPDQNGAVGMSGRFSRRGRGPHGNLQVITPRCGNTGKLSWRAHFDS